MGDSSLLFLYLFILCLNSIYSSIKKNFNISPNSTFPFNLDIFCIFVVTKILTLKIYNVMKKFFALFVMFAAVAFVSCCNQQKNAECCDECCADKTECVEACCADCEKKAECAEKCCADCEKKAECAEKCCKDCEKKAECAEQCCGECKKAECAEQCCKDCEKKAECAEQCCGECQK